MAKTNKIKNPIATQSTVAPTLIYALNRTIIASALGALLIVKKGGEKEIKDLKVHTKEMLDEDMLAQLERLYEEASTAKGIKILK